MLKTTIWKLSILAALIFSVTGGYSQYTKFVRPHIGTAHCRWFHFTPGAVPFGMAKPAPSTNGSLGNRSGWEATGYDYRDSTIEGFPNFHEFQIGGVVFAPITGALQTVPGALGDPESGYRSRFDRKDETAEAGFYSVLLKDYGVVAELTSTPRVAFHRYRFPGGSDAHVIFDIGNRQGESGPVRDAHVVLREDGKTIEGSVTTLPFYIQKYQPGAVVTLYFSAVVEGASAKAHGAFIKNSVMPDVDSVTGVGSGIYLSFGKDKQDIVVKAGLSYTSVANARLNRETEASGLSFDAAKARAAEQWNDYLSRIHVETPVENDKIKFYTGLYHALLGRGLCSDVNGYYPKNDGSVGRIPAGKNGKPQFNHYNTDAIWGAFWNLTQLWAMAYPEYYSDFVKSQLLIYRDAGWLADGIANSRFVSGVGTNFVSLVIASAYMSGIKDFDISTGYAAALKNELEWVDRPAGAGKLDVDRFRRYGYVNHLDSGEGSGERWQFSASHTLEYAFSAHAVAQWARVLGKKRDYDTLTKLSNAWRKIFDTTSALIRPKKADGRFIDNFNPSEPWRGFQEGNAWQYSFYVPHQPEALVAAVGKDSFNYRLNRIFETSRKNKFGGGTTIDAFSGLDGLYNHGNQPCLHISWLFNYSGRPSLTQRWVRTICNEFYGTDGIHGYGYGQDEDQGQLGAWYVISSIGLFDVGGLTAPRAEMGVGSPLFTKVRIRLNPKYHKGKEFVINALNNDSTNIYVQNATLNGKKLKRPFVPFEEIIKGGELRLQMTDTPVDELQ